MTRKKKKRKNLTSGNRSLVRKNIQKSKLPFRFDSQFNSDLPYNLNKKLFGKDPYNLHNYINLADELLDQGRLDEAISCYHRALQLKPDAFRAHYNMGNALLDQRRLDEAIACYQRALQLKPDAFGAHYNMGNALLDQGRLDEAIACYQRALQLKPDFSEAHNNVGIALQEQGKWDAAISFFQRALQLRPDFVDARNNMGNVFASQGKRDEAIACYQKVLQERPYQAETCSNLVLQLRDTCTWEELHDLEKRLDSLTKKALDRGEKPGETPFVSLVTYNDLSRNLSVAKSWSLDIARRMSDSKVPFPFRHRRLSKTRITIGYISSDFHDHPTAHLMLGLFRLHDRHEFKTFCYSYGKRDENKYRTKIEQDCDKFVDLLELTHADAAKCIYKDCVDILVDLKGFTEDNRLAICALRPAPVQVSWLGYPGTTGADFLDYIITDRIVTPEHHAPYFSEKFAYLPDCYQVNDHMQPISDKVYTRSDFGLPEAGFVFCSFNQGYKIDPVMFDTWMKILERKPKSTLWLLHDNEIAEGNLKREAEARNINPERLVFSEKLPKREHLRRLALADLALDTRVCNGHTTTSDALWAGVPVISMQGNHFASRVSSSILTAVRLPELITHSLEEYQVLAVQLAQDPDELRSIRQRLSENRLRAPLFDTPRFARNLEKVYQEMWEMFLAGEKPRQIEVAET